MDSQVTDLVLEVANIVAFRHRTLTPKEVEASVCGVITGLNLVDNWLRAGGGEVLWTTTAKLLMDLYKNDVDLEAVILQANVRILGSNKKFDSSMFVKSDFRVGAYEARYKEGICKGFLHGMRLYDAHQNMSSISKSEFVLSHLSVVKSEIEKFV